MPTVRNQLLLDCPYCGAGKFTIHGLFAHLCPKLRNPWDVVNRRMSREQWEEAVQTAKTRKAQEQQLSLA